MTATPNSSLDSNNGHLALLQADFERVEKFKEHIQLMHDLASDPTQKVMFAHLLDEEAEHVASLQELIRQAQAPGISHSANHSANHHRDVDHTLTVAGTVSGHHADASTVKSESADPQGHFKRRDQNILTVGSLIGHRN
jgi:hypothetical protein